MKAYLFTLRVDVLSKSAHENDKSLSNIVVSLKGQNNLLREKLTHPWNSKKKTNISHLSVGRFIEQILQER